MILNEICEFIIDCEHKTAPIQETGIPSIRTPNIGKGNLIFEGVNRVSEDTYTQWTKRGELKPGDLIIAREAPVGNVAIIPDDMKVCLGQRTVLVRPNSDKVNSKYLCYYLLGNEAQGQILTKTSGSTVAHLNMKDIRGLKIKNLPPRQIQQKIASILSAYDDLIENNNRRIQLLEEMASEIYKEWFVRLRFPGYENAVFKDKDGKVVDRESDGALPDGWTKDQLSNIIQTVKRKPKVKKDQYLEKGLIPVIDQGTDLIAGYVNDEKYLQDDALPVLVFGDHTRRVKFIDFPFASGADGTQLIYPKNKNLLPTYFYLAIKEIDLSNFHYARHFKFLKAEFVLIPDDETLIKFNELTKPFLKEIDVLRSKNQVLQETRDLLLPRLISGKLSVEKMS